MGFSPHGGGGGNMSPEEAEQFFSMFFGGSDPFGGMGGSMHGGRPSQRGGAQDPFSIFGGGMGGSMPGMHMAGGMPGGMHMSGGMPGGMPGGMHMSGGMPGMPGGSFPGGMPGGMSQQPKRWDAIPVDTIVSLKGLVSAAHLNGDRGLIMQYIPSSGRYVVQLEDSDETMSVKASNILQHVHVKVHGIASKPELNGQRGTVIAWNPASERYSIHVMNLQKVISLKPTNVVLEAGTVGQVVGLASKPELNGKWGTVKAWIRDTNKYDLQLSASKIIRIKVENLRV